MEFILLIIILTVKQSDLPEGIPCPYCGAGILVTTKDTALALWQNKERDCEHGRAEKKDYYMQVVEYVRTVCTTDNCYSGNGQETVITNEWFCGTKEKEGRIQE